METKKIFSQNLKWMLEASNMSEGELYGYNINHNHEFILNGEL